MPLQNRWRTEHLRSILPEKYKVDRVTMYNHEPDGYVCPFCKIIQQAADPALTGMVWRGESAAAFLGLARWKNNPVDVVVIPNKHYENLYDLPVEFAPALQRITRAVALALKAVYGCDGISTRQHNEPAGNQDVWHYHIHVTPRFLDDDFYRSNKIEFLEDQRLREAGRLRQYLVEHQQEITLEK